jgi:hypothetical protein
MKPSEVLTIKKHEVELRVYIGIVFFCAFCFNCSFVCYGQDTIRILHYTETTGYDHGTRNFSAAMFQRICDSLNSSTAHLWLLQTSDVSEVFDDLALLSTFKVVVWANTSGANGLTIGQRQNYEQYVLNGGNYIGIHAASDTYRHSTCNGNNIGVWDFYAENMSGCSVQENPNHTASNYMGAINHISINVMLTGIPNPWSKVEEYYYWENGFINNSYNTLLEVATTGFNSYDSSRMVALYKEHNWGSKSFYTSLGHDVNNYVNDSIFELLLKNALVWTAAPINALSLFSRNHGNEVIIAPNPASTAIYIRNIHTKPFNFSIFDLLGNMVLEGVSNSEINLTDLNKGIYQLVIDLDHETYAEKIIKL